MLVINTTVTQVHKTTSLQPQLANVVITQLTIIILFVQTITISCVPPPPTLEYYSEYIDSLMIYLKAMNICLKIQFHGNSANDRSITKLKRKKKNSMETNSMELFYKVRNSDFNLNHTFQIFKSALREISICIIKRKCFFAKPWVSEMWDVAWNSWRKRLFCFQAIRCDIWVPKLLAQTLIVLHLDSMSRKILGMLSIGDLPTMKNCTKLTSVSQTLST